jgi:hypothetical protein
MFDGRKYEIFLEIKPSTKHVSKPTNQSASQSTHYTLFNIFYQVGPVKPIYLPEWKNANV